MKENKEKANAVKVLHHRYIKDQPERKASLQEERIKAQVAQLIYDLRKDAGLTQQQLAEMIGTTQSVISRLEDSDYEGHSLTMLERIAKALNSQIRIHAVEVNSKATPIRHAFQVLVRALRKKHGLNVEQLAQELEIEPAYVIELEQNSSHRPSPMILYKLSRYFKIPQAKLNFLAGASKEIPPDFQIQASQFAAQSESFSKLTKDEKKLLDDFVRFLRQESV
ncbi:MAG: helix-turn-helix domain-containing protein [Candidatus Aminicenantes bacterium]|nr:MAG: helix-turn-helix domain-containing protein [Candidatus Aminicenantes bacterium]